MDGNVLWTTAQSKLTKLRVAFHLKKRLLWHFLFNFYSLFSGSAYSDHRAALCFQLFNDAVEQQRRAELRRRHDDVQPLSGAGVAPGRTRRASRRQASRRARHGATDVPSLPFDRHGLARRRRTGRDRRAEGGRGRREGGGAGAELDRGAALAEARRGARRRTQHDHGDATRYRHEAGVLARETRRRRPAEASNQTARTPQNARVQPGENVRSL